MWTARGINKVPLVSGSHTQRLRLGEALVGALGVAFLLFLAINNLRTQKPNQTKTNKQKNTTSISWGRWWETV